MENCEDRDFFFGREDLFEVEGVPEPEDDESSEIVARARASRREGDDGMGWITRISRVRYFG